VRVWPWLMLSLLLTPLACQREDVVLRVDGLSVTKEEFVRELHLLTEGEKLPSDELQELKKALVEEFVERIIVLKEAAKRHITVPQEEVQAIVERMGLKVEDEEERQSLERRLRGLLLKGKLTDLLIKDLPLPSEEEIKAYYEEHKEEYILPERVKVRQILVASEQEAKKILATLKKTTKRRRRKGKKPPSFAELARRHSIAPEASKGGDLGFVSKDEVPQEFEVIFGLKEGEISPIVKSPYGYHIFLVEKREKGRPLEYEEVRGEITTVIMNKKVEEAWRRWLENRRKNLTIWVNERLLAELS